MRNIQTYPSQYDLSPHISVTVNSSSFGQDQLLSARVRFISSLMDPHQLILRLLDFIAFTDPAGYIQF
jgi:hypothetical protein